jgi:plastocyanin
VRKFLGLALAAVLVVSLTAPALAAAPVKKATVNDNGFSFGPHKLIIRKGVKVVWDWSGGPISHNVTVLHGPFKFHSATKAHGTYSHVFNRTGTWVLYCTIHPFMKETVVVR